MTDETRSEVERCPTCDLPSTWRNRDCNDPFHARSEAEGILRALQAEIIARRDQAGFTQHDRDTMAAQANAISTVLARADR